jgi:hypothetical protein
MPRKPSQDERTGEAMVTLDESAMGKNLIWVKRLVYLLFLALVSAMVFLCRYLLLALIYAISLISTDDFDRNALLNAVVEAEKDSGSSTTTRAREVSPARDPDSLPR